MEKYIDFIDMKKRTVDTILECILMHGADEPSVVSNIGSMATVQFFSDSNIILLKTEIAKAGKDNIYNNSVIISTITSALHNSVHNDKLSLIDYIYQLSITYCDSLNVIHDGSEQLFVSNGILNKKELKRNHVLLSCFAINIFYKDILKGIKDAKNK